MGERNFKDNNGFQHKAVFDAQGKIVSDKRMDKTGKVIGEGVYKNGVFVGEKQMGGRLAFQNLGNGGR